MKMLSALLTLPMVLSLALPARAEKQDLATFDVVNLEFFVKNPKAKKSYEKEIEVGKIEMKADMSNNRIRNFNVVINTRYGNLYEYSASLSELRGKTLPLKTSGVSLGQLQGVNMNADGEGTLKFSPPASLLGPNMPKSIELTLKRVGAQKNWVVLYKSQVLRSAKIELSKNPLEMNSWSLLMSSPKLLSMQTEFLGCDNMSVASILLKYEAPELLKIPKCNFSNAKPKDVQDIVSTLSGRLDVYEGFYAEGRSPTDLQNKMLWSLEVLKSFGLQIKQKDLIVKIQDGDSASFNELFYDLVASGQEEVIKNLISQGLVPTGPDAHQKAVLNVYQVNPKTREVVESSMGRRILNLVRPTIQKKGSAADLLLSLTGYEGSRTQSLTRFEYEPEQMFNTNFELTKRINELMISEGFDLQTGDSSWGKSATSWILSAAPDNDDSPFYTKAQAQVLVQQLKQAGAK